MKIVFQIFCTINFIVWINIAFSQTNLIIPTKGIEGNPVVIDSTNISEVINLYGKDFLKTEKSWGTYYLYDKIGLTFEINPFDKNQIVRSIYAESPFQAITSNGIVLNKSSMNDVWKLYNNNGCYTGKNDAYSPQKGVTFYINKDSNEKGYNPEELIFKIEIHNKREYGISSRINFEFNDEPLKSKLQELISILEEEKFDFEKLESFWKAEKETEKAPYGLEKRVKFIREIENKLIQENIEFNIVGGFYSLNIVKSGERILYLKFSDQNYDKIIFERKDTSKLYKIDTLNFPTDNFTYGTFCGIAGMPPEKCQEMLQLVKEKKYESLVVWLNSYSPEIATYGYIGLDFLSRNGKDIAPKELKRMKELRNSEIQLNTCQGCIYGVTEKIKDVLTKKNLDEEYQSFKETGWLN